MNLYDIEKARNRIRTCMRRNERYLDDHAATKGHGVISNECLECRFRVGWIQGLLEALIMLGARPERYKP